VTSISDELMVVKLNVAVFSGTELSRCSGRGCGCFTGPWPGRIQYSTEIGHSPSQVSGVFNLF